jgi:glucosyl-3-phosphoglycerate synthase
MRAVVVVPAHNEEETIGACLRALAAQEGLTHDDYQVVLVLNACSDATEERARRVDVPLTIIHGPGGGPGPARRVGMDLAAPLLDDDGLIASTDADTVVAPDWLARQLDAVASGADAVGGWIELDDAELHPRVLEHRTARAAVRLAAVLAHTPHAEHHHFAGASMSLTAGAYRTLGGIEPLEALEDEALERALRAHGLRVDRLRSVRVRTSARLVGRASAGLARDLAAATAAIRVGA